MGEILSNFEILQNNFINDVLVALSGIYFFKDNLSQISTLDDLSTKLKGLKGQPYIDSLMKYTLTLDSNFEDFVLVQIRILQNILDVKKDGKKEFMNQDWIPNDTNNWLKNDGTYKEIYEKVIKKLKQ